MMCSVVSALVVGLLLAFTSGYSGYSGTPTPQPTPTCVCDRRECEIVNEFDCPGLGVVVWDPCQCCQECARTEGEPCGGELGFSGTCEPGLSCVHPGPSPTEGTCTVLTFDDDVANDIRTIT